MNDFKKIKSLGILLGIILIGVAMILLFFPDMVIDVLAKVIGVVLAFTGGIRGIWVLMKWKDLNAPIWKFALGLILLFCGVYILVNTRVTVGLLSIVIGIFAVVSSIDRFSVAMQRRKVGERTISAFLFGIIHLVFGGLLIFLPIVGSSMLVMLAGCYLLVAGAMIILSTCYFFDF